MFILSNSYQIKDLKNDIFTTVFETNTPISFFTSIGEIQTYSSGTDLFSLSKNKSKKIADLRSVITCLKANNMLICAGTLNGEIHIFSEHRSAVRQFKNHTADITDIIITPSNLVISTGKDGKINFIDLQEGNLKHSIQMKSGYARRVIATNTYIFIFSKNLSIYSIEDYSLVKEISIGSVVEHAIQISDQNIFFTSWNKGYILNIDTFEISHPSVLHSREITMAQVYENKIYTCSHDGHFKSFNFKLKCISDILFQNKLVSFVLQNNIPFVVTNDGKILSIEQKKDFVEQRKMRRSKLAYDEEIEYSIAQDNRKKLSEIDMMLKNYEYKGAVKFCIAKNDLSQTFAVLKYIHEKRQLLKVVTDADIDFLRNLLLLCLETIKITEFTSIIVELVTILTSRFQDEIIYNEDIKSLISEIGNELNEIVAFEEINLKAISFIESFPQK